MFDNHQSIPLCPEQLPKNFVFLIMIQKLIFLLLFSLLAVSTSTFAQVDPEAALAERYFLDEEYESALELYQKLHRKSPTEVFTLRVVACQERLGQFEAAEKFLDKAIRKQSNMVILPIVKADLLEKTGKIKEADKLYSETITKKLRIEGDFIRVGSYLYQTGKLELSREAYMQGRKRMKSDFIFANEIANIFAQLGSWENATYEYLNEYYANPTNLDKVKLDVLNLVNPTSEPLVEKALLNAVDKQQSDIGLRSVLFEFYVLAENFMEAFIQVKSIDRLFKEDGHRVFTFAETMRNNENYALSNDAYDYIIERKKKSPYFFRAHIEKAVNNELKAFQQIPVDLVAVRTAVDTYEKLFNEFGREVNYFDAIYRQARLRVFYLDEMERALGDLELISVKRTLPKDEWAKAKLLMGDIQLIQKDYSKAKLTYTEVKEQFQDRQIGALAKYKLGELAYFKGDFSLSQAMLGAIKDNTSNDISNDAIKLNLLIIDNTGLDTTTVPLEIFAEAQLLVYQRDYDAALVLLDTLAFNYPAHGLADEILWEKATIALKRNEIEKALEYIERVLANFKEDIYGDDALYTKARLYDYNMKNHEMAQKFYLEFLSTYPGSLYSVEVRKRIRELRKMNNNG